MENCSEEKTETPIEKKVQSRRMTGVTFSRPRHRWVTMVPRSGCAKQARQGTTVDVEIIAPSCDAGGGDPSRERRNSMFAFHDQESDISEDRPCCSIRRETNNEVMETRRQGDILRTMGKIQRSDGSHLTRTRDWIAGDVRMQDESAATTLRRL